MPEEDFHPSDLAHSQAHSFRQCVEPESSDVALSRWMPDHPPEADGMTNNKRHPVEAVIPAVC